VPSRSLVHDLIASVHEGLLDERAGEILHGIPALEDVDPDTFGICMATADGYVYEIGDTQLPFCIQSISKPFTYGIALSDQGVEAVDRKIDIEPSGEVYNEISLHPVTHRPRNPMINAGALVAASLVGGDTVADQVERISRVFSGYAGRELSLDEDIFSSQVKSGHRNRAIGHMLREFEILDGDPNLAHEAYLRACSTMVTCRDLSLMGATWANGGVNPITGERVLTTELTERVLSVMSTCGMYDAAGEWVAEVGMAAKSGVGGGIVAVLPGQLSIAVFSPRLDEHGNSVRAFKACRQLSHDLELHALHVARSAHSAIRDSHDVAEVPSAIQRPEADRLVLEEHGHKARIYELQGDLLFSGVESVVREVCEAGADLEFLAADVRRVTDVADVSRRLLVDLRGFLEDQGCEAFLIDPDGLLSQGPGGNGDRAPWVFPTMTSATVHFEDELLRRYGERPTEDGEFDFTETPGLDDVPSEVVEELGNRLEPRSFADGELIVSQGDAEAGVFLIVRGRVRSSAMTPKGDTRSLATLAAGRWFGGIYVVTGNPHPLTMHADGSVDALELTRGEFERIRHGDPELRAAVLSIFMFAIHEDVDRMLGALATGRVALR
jgi:glutaminase